VADSVAVLADRKARPWRWLFVCKTCGGRALNGLHNNGPWFHADNDEADHEVVPMDRIKYESR
jgi:hypothetical protein